jgi:hypothetical protein
MGTEPSFGPNGLTRSDGIYHCCPHPIDGATAGSYQMITSAVVEIMGLKFDVTVEDIGGEDAGSSDACERTIKIDSKMPRSTQVETFYHELTHMWLELSGYSKLLGPELDEALAQSLGVAMYQFSQANPDTKIWEMFNE